MYTGVPGAQRLRISLSERTWGKTVRDITRAKTQDWEPLLPEEKAKQVQNIMQPLEAATSCTKMTEFHHVVATISPRRTPARVSGLVEYQPR
jgi:hypothetical protein